MNFLGIPVLLKGVLIKKYFFLFLFPFLLSVSYCFAADPTSEDYYQQFLKNFRQYQAESSYYQNIKAKHLSYQSVASRADYLEEAKKYLLLEIEATQAYSRFIRTRLVEVTQILKYQESLYFVKLDDELSYLEELKKKTYDASAVSEILKLWVDFEKHFQIIGNYGYGIKAYIEILSLEKNIENLKITKNNVSQFLSEIPLENSYLKAAKDNFSLSEKQYQEIIAQVSQIKSFYDQHPLSGLNKEANQSISSQINQASVKSKSLITNYKKLIISLITQ